MKCEEENLNNLFLKFEGVVRQLISSGAKLEKIDFICHLLITLPEANNNDVTAIETLTPDHLN